MVFFIIWPLRIIFWATSVVSHTSFSPSHRKKSLNNQRSINWLAIGWRQKWNFAVMQFFAGPTAVTSQLKLHSKNVCASVSFFIGCSEKSENATPQPIRCFGTGHMNPTPKYTRTLIYLSSKLRLSCFILNAPINHRHNAGKTFRNDTLHSCASFPYFFSHWSTERKKNWFD